jgi:hypothetical protein
MKTRFFVYGFALCVLAFSGAAMAEPVRRVSGAVVLVADVVPNAPAELADLELCPAPPAGSSRLITRDEMKRRLSDLGADATQLALPSVVRIEAEAERWSAKDLSAKAAAALRTTLPPAVTLESLKTTRNLVVPLGARVGSVRVQVPRREGRHELTGTVEITLGEKIVSRAPVRVAVNVPAGAFEPAITRGSRVTLVIEQGSTRVGASAMAMTDVELGGEAMFKVTTTGRVLKARVLTRETAVVVEK